jgi:hypothetical protein
MRASTRWLGSAPTADSFLISAARFRDSPADSASDSPSLRCSLVHSLHTFCTAETKSERSENRASECGAFPALDSWVLFPCRAQQAPRNDREWSALRTPWRGGVVLLSKGMGGWNGSEVVSALTVVPAGCQDICDDIQVRIFRANVGGCCPRGRESGSLRNERAGIAEPASRWGKSRGTTFSAGVNPSSRGRLEN